MRGENYQPDHRRERVNIHLIIFLHRLSTQYGILQMDMRLMKQRSKLKSMKRKMNHWSGKTSWSGWVLCLMVLFSCWTLCPEMHAVRNWKRFTKSINSTKLILLWHIWLKFVQIVNSVKQISLWTKLAKIVKSMNIHLVSHFYYCMHFWIVLLSG